MATDDYDTEVVKIFGGPGTGKTTTMVGNTDIENFQGICHRLFDENPRNVMLIAYTSSAADEARDRLYELTDANKSVLKKKIRTIHSLVMGYNNAYPDNIVELRYQPDKKNFCEQVGLHYDTSSSDDDDIMDVPDDEGHLFFRMVGWMKSNMLELKEWDQCPVASEWTRGDDFIYLVNDWENYKDTRGIYEFDDLIRESVNKGHTVDVEHLFVDEVQDLYPLQQAFLDNQFEVVDRIWLAGDDDQTIYEWAGARPEYFINMEPRVNERRDELWDDKAGYWDSDGVYILDQSWRMPSEVLNLSKLAIEQVDERQEKNLKPHHDGGEVIPLRNSRTSQVIDYINHDDTIILFRANFQANEFGKKLIQEGIPFKDRFRTWRDEVVELRDAIGAIKNDSSNIPGNQAARIIKEMPDFQLRNAHRRDAISERFNSQPIVSTDEVVDEMVRSKPESRMELMRWFNGFDSNELENLNYYQGQAVKNNILADKEHMTPDGLRLETIHWSKGKEADTVILSLSTTGTVQAQMVGRGLPNAERRVYYVGLTRTKNRVVLAENLHDESPTLTMDDLFGEDWREHTEYYDTE